MKKSNIDWHRDLINFGTENEVKYYMGPKLNCMNGIPASDSLTYGSNTAATSFLEHDVMDKYIYEEYSKNVNYQIKKFNSYDHLLVWLYTFNSSVFTRYLLTNKKSPSIEGIIIFYIAAKIFFMDNEKLLKDKIFRSDDFNKIYKAIDLLVGEKIETILITNDIKTKNFQSNIFNIGRTLLPEALAGEPNTIDKLNIISLDYLELFCYRFNKMIMNAPKLKRDLIVYKIANLPKFIIEKMEKLDTLPQNMFNSTSYNRYSNIGRFSSLNSGFHQIHIPKDSRVLFINKENASFGYDAAEVVLPIGTSFNVIKKATKIISYYNLKLSEPIYNTRGYDIDNNYYVAPKQTSFLYGPDKSNIELIIKCIRGYLIEANIPTINTYKRKSFIYKSYSKNIKGSFNTNTILKGGGFMKNLSKIKPKPKSKPNPKHK
ncbi:MAG: hypothetical protein ACOCRK_02110 [bacterium]